MNRVVHTASNEMEARLVCDLLESHGIAFRMSGSSLTPLRGALPLSEAAVTVAVLRDEDLEPARALLAELDRPDAKEGSWRCFDCGEESPGSFEVCWKCGRAADVVARSAAASPYRGATQAPPESAAAPDAVAAPSSAGDARVLLWALGAGCLPVILTTLWFSHHHDALENLTPAGRAGLNNIVSSLELYVCLRLLRRRGVRLREAWGGGDRWLPDLVAALMLSGLLFIVPRAVHHLLRAAGAPAPVHSGGSAFQGPFIVAADWPLIVPGISICAAAGALVLYGVVLVRLRALLRSRVAAVVLTAAVATLMWAPSAGLSTLGATFASQLILAGAFVAGGRVWPLAIAAAGSHFLRLMLLFFRD